MSTTTSIYFLEWRNHDDNYVHGVDTNDDASKDEFYVTYAADEHVDNHDHDDNTDDDHDNNKDLYARACDARVNTRMVI